MRALRDGDTGRVAAGLLAVLILAGCRGEGPPALAVRIAELPEVNTPGAFMDSIALAPDGSRVATGERSGVIKVWTPGGPAEPVSLRGYRQAIADLAFSPDGALLASIGRARESTLRLWQDDRARGWTEAAAIPIGRCLALRFDAAGARLAVMCETEVMVLDGATRGETARLTNPHPEALTAFDLAASGRRLVTAGHEGGVTVWEVATATPVQTFSVRRSRRTARAPRGVEPETAWAVAVALSPDGARAAAATIEGTVFVWDLDKGVELLADVDNDATGPPHGALRFGADGRLLAPTGDRSGMRLIDVSRKRAQIVETRGKPYHAVSITDDATRYAVVTSTLSDGRLTYTVGVWRVDRPAPR